ncbi:MAG: hypothetical protein Ct9H300mP13_7980 [Gammaproteobacteria bacterium]|nr:MAG: hypothetical protein Ct9H300mP13_7980 [Gammaproteobacteria bacterium]
MTRTFNGNLFKLKNTWSACSDRGPYLQIDIGLSPAEVIRIRRMCSTETATSGPMAMTTGSAKDLARCQSRGDEGFGVTRALQ